MIVKITDGQGTTFYGDVVRASFIEGICRFSQVAAGAVHVLDVHGCTARIMTEHGELVEEKVIPPKESVA